MASRDDSDTPQQKAERATNSSPVDKVAIAVKHPGVFMETTELEAETGTKVTPPTSRSTSPSDQLKKRDEDEDGETIKKEEDVSDGIPEATEEEEDKTPVKRPKARRKGSKRSSKGKGSKAKADNRSSSKPDIKMEETDNDLSQGEDLVGGDATSSKTEDSSKTEALVKRGSEIEMSSDLAAAGGGAVASTSVKSEAASSADEGQDKDEAMSVTPRRSNRRQLLQQKKEEAKKAKTEAEEEDDVAGGGGDHGEDYQDQDDDGLEDEEAMDTGGGGGTGAEGERKDTAASSSVDRFEMESVCSELESVESGSTSARSTRRSQRADAVGNNSSKPPASKGKKGGAAPVRGSKKKMANSAANNRGKSRRAIFKRSATKAPTAVARAVTSDRIFYNGQYFCKGDIVSVVDVEGGVYYAQLKGFLTDQYCEKSGVITWLLPTTESPPPEQGFDPSTYIVGPEEELPRRLEHFTFVMHAPDDYFYYANAPYPTATVDKDQEYLLTRLGPKVRLLKPNGVPVFT